MPCGCSPCGNGCWCCGLIRREVKAVGVVRTTPTTTHWTLFVLLLLWSDAPGAAPPSHITLLVVDRSSHQAIAVVSTAVREWSSPSVTVRGSADSWPGLEVYNERQGREFLLLLNCACIVGGALCTRSFLHHHHTPYTIGNHKGVLPPQQKNRT